MPYVSPEHRGPVHSIRTRTQDFAHPTQVSKLAKPNFKSHFHSTKVRGFDSRTVTSRYYYYLRPFTPLSYYYSTMLFLYLSALLSVAAAIRPTREAQQFDYPRQDEALHNPWDRIDIHELDKQLAAWHNEPVSSTKRPVEIDVQARQGYHDIPRPIPPVIPILPVPTKLPQGCLAPRGQFPSPRSCAHYLNCWDDVVIEQQCPEGLWFNEEISACDFEYNTYCHGRPAPPPKPELPPGSKFCPEPNGRYRSSTNCSEFFVCVYGRPVKYGCPRGLVYNEALGVCDYPFRVDCRGASVPPTSPQPTYPPRPTRPTPPPQQPQPPYQPHYPPTYPPQQPQYPNPWLAGESRIEPDPWHQRPVASQIEIQREQDKINEQNHQQTLQELGQQGVDIGPLIGEQDPPQKPTVINPWQEVHSIPAQLIKLPCKDGDIHRLTDSCSTVVVCRKGRPQLVQCPLGETYDRVTDSCKVFTVAKC